jgi:hypothetical protein
MKYAIFELVQIYKNNSEDKVSVLEELWFEQNKYNTKEAAIKKVKELKAVKFSYERFFTIIEIY